MHKHMYAPFTEIALTAVDGMHSSLIILFSKNPTELFEIRLKKSTVKNKWPEVTHWKRSKKINMFSTGPKG